MVISYLEGIVHLLLGNNTAHVICTANANQLALTMRLNEESVSLGWPVSIECASAAEMTQSYEGLDPIESEIRRRIYWLLFQADKSTACMRARSINLRLEDAAVGSYFTMPLHPLPPAATGGRCYTGDTRPWLIYSNSDYQPKSTTSK